MSRKHWHEDRRICSMHNFVSINPFKNISIAALFASCGKKSSRPCPDTRMFSVQLSFPPLVLVNLRWTFHDSIDGDIQQSTLGGQANASCHYTTIFFTDRPTLAAKSRTSLYFRQKSVMPNIRSTSKFRKNIRSVIQTTTSCYNCKYFSMHYARYAAFRRQFIFSAQTSLPLSLPHHSSHAEPTSSLAS